MDIQLWRELLEPYELAVDELVVKFNHLILASRKAGVYSPIEQVNGRVKSISSILEKCQKKGIDFENFEEEVDDIAGIRIICQFVEDIHKVVELIHQRTDMKIRGEKDYISNIKESGYRSYHINVLYTVESLKGPKEIQVEIQIRTLAMNFWAVIEHSLQYKYKENMPQILRERLQTAAEAIKILDEQMASVRGEIMDAQYFYNIKANTVSEILTAIQNLYKVANKREVVKIQEEFFKIYSEGDLNELERFNRELDVIAEGYRAQSLH